MKTTGSEGEKGPDLKNIKKTISSAIQKAAPIAKTIQTTASVASSAINVITPLLSSDKRKDEFQKWRPLDFVRDILQKSTMF